MAKRSSDESGFKRFLQFIGLVEEVVEEQPDSRGNQGGGFGQNAYYASSRQKSTTARPSNQHRRNASPQGNQRTYGRDEDFHRPNRFYERDEDFRRTDRSYDRTDEGRRSARAYDRSDENRRSASGASTSRPRSRFEPEEDSSVRRTRASGAGARGDSGSFMLTLYNLRDARKVIRALVSGQTVIMSIDSDDDDLRMRITDTLSGAIFALGGTFRKAGNQTYVLAPKGVNVQSDGEAEDDD